MGEGWVAWPGGEPVEGFSNPTWTALLAATDFIGPGPWLMGKMYGLFFGALTLPLVFLWARELTGDKGLIPVVAPAYLAVSPQFATWCAAGLENSLFTFLLALGCWRLLLELKHGGTPWSILPMGLLGITRPEAPMYVALAAGVMGVVWLKRDPKKALWVPLWALATAVPWVLYEGYRMWVFAWPLPNTYYAKLALDVEKFHPFAWAGGHGWSYLRNWALWSGWGFVLPLMPMVALGKDRWRGALAVGAGSFMAVMLFSGVAWGEHIPGWPFLPDRPDWIHIRIGTLFACALLLPWLGLGRDVDAPRLLAWCLASAAAFFVLFAGPDWMDGFRWLNMAVVPLSVLLADLVHMASDLFPKISIKQGRQLAFSVVAGIPLVAGVVHTIELLNGTETSPFDVHKRVQYMQTVQERLHIDNVVNLEVDFGAQMWWSGDELVDMAGLMDTSVAHHAWEKDFMTEYVFTERKPHFVHAHGNWKNRAGLASIGAYTRNYIEISPYPAGRRLLHVGNAIRRDTFVVDHWPGANERKTRFGTRLDLEGIDIPAPQVMPGGSLFVSLGYSVDSRPVAHFRTLLALTHSDTQVVWDLPPAYDWIPPERWRPTEVYLGRHTLNLPDDLPLGDYSVSLLLIGKNGEVMSAKDGPTDVLLGHGEAQWANIVHVQPPEAVLEQVSQAQQGLLAEAAADRCHSAEATLQRARHHLPADHPQQLYNNAAITAGLASCWARVAQQQGSQNAIQNARRWDHHNPEVLAAGRQLADGWEAEGNAALAKDDDLAAYTAWHRALIADPRRLHLRRAAEEARDRRLGLTSR
jgi:hypothetical protein